MPPRLVEQWIPMYEVWPTVEGTPNSRLHDPAFVRRVEVCPERTRDPAQRRWRVRSLRPDGSVASEDWVRVYNFRRLYYPTEVEAWEGLLALAQEQLDWLRERTARTEREIGELEQMVRYKQWQADQTPTEP